MKKIRPSPAEVHVNEVANLRCVPVVGSILPDLPLPFAGVDQLEFDARIDATIEAGGVVSNDLKRARMRHEVILPEGNAAIGMKRLLDLLPDGIAERQVHPLAVLPFDPHEEIAVPSVGNDGGVLMGFGSKFDALRPVFELKSRTGYDDGIVGHFWIGHLFRDEITEGIGNIVGIDEHGPLGWQFSLWNNPSLSFRMLRERVMNRNDQQKREESETVSNSHYDKIAENAKENQMQWTLIGGECFPENPPALNIR